MFLLTETTFFKKKKLKSLFPLYKTVIAYL